MKHAPTFKIDSLTINLTAPSPNPVSLSLLTALMGSKSAVSPPATTDIPALNEYWPGQGGLNGGPVPARDGVPFHYLILATKDVGRHEWGGYGDESEATSKLDGLANTKALLAEGGHPGAEACAAYTADGHNDFYLGAPAEMYQIWVNAPESLAKEDWYQTSTQRSAILAYVMDFDDGTQGFHGKDYERLARPVRRFFP